VAWQHNRLLLARAGGGRGKSFWGKHSRLVEPISTMECTPFSSNSSVSVGEYEILLDETEAGKIADETETNSRSETEDTNILLSSSTSIIKSTGAQLRYIEGDHYLS
jgi:hypothetical protein